MNWNNLNFDWQSAKYFYIVASEGSFSAAALKIRVSQPTLSRHVASLEEDLGVSLFERSVKGLVLTDSGVILFEQVKNMAESALSLSRTADSNSNTLDGRVCISANQIVATCLLPKVIKEINLEYPNIFLEVIATDSISDLTQMETDIAIRNFRPSHPDVIVKKLAPLKARFYATSEYLANFPSPVTFESLKQARFIDFHDVSTIHNFLSESYSELEIEASTMHVHSAVVRFELVKQGVGIGLFIEEIGKDDPSLIDVFPDLPSLTYDNWLVARNEMRTSRRLKAVFDIIANQFND